MSTLVVDGQRTGGEPAGQRTSSPPSRHSGPSTVADDIAEALGVGYDRLIRVCADDDERREIARTLNADRRQLTEEQRREVGLALALIVNERGEGVHSLEAIADALQVDRSTVHRDLDELVHVHKLPERRIGNDGKSRPTRRPRPQVMARDQNEQDRAQAALEVIGDTTARRAGA